MYTVTVKLMTDERASYIEECGDTFNGTHINSSTTLETTVIYSFYNYLDASDFMHASLPDALKVEIKMKKVPNRVNRG